MQHDDDTRGMTQRELILEMREDIKVIKEAMVPRREVYGVMAAVVTIGIALVGVIL